MKVCRTFLPFYFLLYMIGMVWDVLLEGYARIILQFLWSCSFTGRHNYFLNSGVDYESVKFNYFILV